MSAVSLPPPPTSLDAHLYRWLYLLFQFVLNIASTETPGTFGPAGVTTVDEAIVPTTGRTIDYLNLGELSLDGVSVNSSATEINQLHTSSIQRNTLYSLQILGVGVNSASFGIGTEAANVINASIQLYNADGNQTADPISFMAYLSDSSAGLGFTAAAPSGGVAIGSNGFVTQLVSGKLFQFITNSSGMVDINITETGTPTWYLCVILPYGNLAISDAITFA